MTEVDEATVVALLRCFHRGDQAGAKAILDSTDHLALIAATAGFTNAIGLADRGGSPEALDRWFGDFLAAARR